MTSDTGKTSFSPVSCSIAGKLAQRSVEKYIWWKRCNPSVNPAGRSVTLHGGRSVTLQTLQGGPEDPWPCALLCFNVSPSFHRPHSVGHTTEIEISPNFHEAVILVHFGLKQWFGKNSLLTIFHWAQVYLGSNLWVRM